MLDFYALTLDRASAREEHDRGVTYYLCQCRSYDDAVSIDVSIDNSDGLWSVIVRKSNDGLEIVLALPLTFDPSLKFDKECFTQDVKQLIVDNNL